MENLMKKVVITGGSGLLGRHVVEHFLEHGYDVVNADMTPDRSSKARYVKVNLQNLGGVLWRAGGCRCRGASGSHSPGIYPPE